MEPSCGVAAAACRHGLILLYKDERSTVMHYDLARHLSISTPIPLKKNSDTTRQPMTTRIPQQKDDHQRSTLIGCGRRKMNRSNSMMIQSYILCIVLRLSYNWTWQRNQQETILVSSDKTPATRQASQNRDRKMEVVAC